MAFGSYSTTPASNTSINGISIAEGCPPGNCNDALRQLAADGRELYNLTFSAASGPFTAADGTVSAPGYTWGSDLNTGFYRIGADDFAATTGGTQRMRFDASGRILVGGESAATGYTNAGDVTLPVARAIRAKNTAKAWAEMVGATGAISSGFNTSSSTRHGAGDYTLTFTDTGGVCIPSIVTTGAGVLVVPNIIGVGTTFVRFGVYRHDTGAAVDPTTIYVTVLG